MEKQIWLKIPSLGQAKGENNTIIKINWNWI